MLPTIKVKEEPADKGYEKTTAVSILTTTVTTSRLNTARPITVSAAKNLSNVTPILQTMSNAVTVGSSHSGPVILTPAGSTGNQSRPVILLPATSLSGSAGQSILLQRAPLQAKSLVANKNPQSLLAAGRTLFHIKGTNITNALNLGSVANTVAGAKAITVGQVRPTTIQTSNAKLPVGGSPILALSAKSNVSDSSQSKARTVCGVVFNSRTLDAIGNPRTTKEYLCNFCQFKTELHHVFNKHLNSHIFSCNHCAFKAFTRYEVITHKRDVHPQFRHELQGFEGFGIDDSRLTNGTFLTPTTPTNSTTIISSVGASAMPKNPIVIAPPMTLNTTTITTGSTPTVSTTAALATKVTTSHPGAQKSGSYFTYKIVHDASTGKPQSYECDICKFRTPLLNDMYSHAATHTLADLQKRGSDNIMWECFYCSFNAGKQNEVVEHVTKDHPGKPIQLKRYTSDKSAREKTDKAVAEAPKEKELPVPVSSIKTEKPDRDEEASEEENCLWGCTYCKTQVPKREEIIDHVRKEHPGKKLVITRRRLNKPAAKPDSEKKRKSVSKENDNDKESENGADSEEEKPRGTNKNKEKEKPQPQEVTPSPKPTDAPPSGRSSRRKQTLPRKVRDSSIDSAPEDKEEPDLNEGAQSSAAATDEDDGDSNSLGNPTPEQLNFQISDPVSLMSLNRNGTDSASQDGSEKSADKSASKASSVRNTPDMTSLNLKRKSKYDLLIAMMKKDNLDNEKQLRALAKDGSPILTSTNSDSKTVLMHSPPMVSLLKGKNLKSLLPKPGPKSKKFKSMSKDAEMDTLEAEAAKADVVFLDSIPDDLQIDHSQHYLYNRNKMTAKCNLCSHTTEGRHCLAHIKEHVMIHTGERLWGCPYCDFKCNRRISMFKHVKSRHFDEPVRLIRRKPYQHPGHRKKLLQSAAGISYSQGTINAKEIPEPKLRGPRSIREKRILETAKHMWQCPYCSRQNVFYGMMKTHVKLAHPQNFTKDGELIFVRQARPRGSPDQLMQQNRIWLKTAKVQLVRYEDMEKYPVLEDILEDNGDSLMHDMDIEGEMPSSLNIPKSENLPKVPKKPASERKPNISRMKYRCCHCEERACRPGLIKVHMIEVHPDKPLELLDMRAKSQKKERKMYMCKQIECDFQSFLKEALYAHIGKNPEHYYDENMPTDEMAQNGGTPMDPILKITSRCSSLRPRVVRHIEPDPIDQILNAAESFIGIDTYMGDETPPILEPVVKTKAENSSRDEADSDRGSDPGTPMLTPPAKQLTLSPLEVIDINGMELKCKYCDFLNSGEPIAMKDHLTSAHPRKDPIAVDVLSKEKRKTSRVFLCQLLFCNFATYNQRHYLRHLKEEHPDMEFLVPLGERGGTPGNANRRTPKTERDEEDFDPSYGARKLSSTQKKRKRAAAARARRLRKKLELGDSVTDTSVFSELPDGLEPETEPLGPEQSPLQSKTTLDRAHARKKRPTGSKPAAKANDSAVYFDAEEDIDNKYTIDGTLLKVPRTNTPNPVHFPGRFQCKAPRCSNRFDTLSDVKRHLLGDHPDIALLVCIDLRAKQLRKKSKVFFCRDEKCRAFFKDEEELFGHDCSEESARTQADPESSSQKSAGEVTSPVGDDSSRPADSGDTDLKPAVSGDVKGEQDEERVTEREDKADTADFKRSDSKQATPDSPRSSQKSESQHSSSRRRSQDSVSDTDNRMINADNDEQGDRVYQCSYCTYISTRQDNIKIHCEDDHECKEGGFTEIESGFSKDGRLVMNVNENSESQSVRRRKSEAESVKSEGSNENEKQDNQPDMEPDATASTESRKRRRSSDSASSGASKKPRIDTEVEKWSGMDVQSSKMEYRNETQPDQGENESSDEEKSSAGDDEEENDENDGEKEVGQGNTDDEEGANEGQAAEEEEEEGGSQEQPESKDKSHSSSSSDESENEGDGKEDNKKGFSGDDGEEDKKMSESSASDTDEEPDERDGPDNSQTADDQAAKSKDETAKAGDTSQSDTSSSSSSSSSSSDDEDESSS